MGRRDGQKDRGAVALMVSAAIIAIFGFVALSVDLGNAWANKRELVNATDASALAAAQEYALHGNGCGTVATSFINKNKSDATLLQCSPSAGAVAGATSGDVLIEADTTVDYAFAPVIGTNSSTFAATTIARYGIPLALRGLRPFGLCSESLFAMPQYMAWDYTMGPSADILIIYDKSGNPNACNGGDPVPGNWGMMDFDGGANSNSDTQNWTQNGYPDLVYPGGIPGDTGAFSPSLASELQMLKDTQLKFPIPIFASAGGNGSNAVFDVVGFVSVQVVDYKTSGSQANRSLTLRFVAAVAEGVCCDPGGIDTGTRVVQICAVEAADRPDCVVS